MCFVHDQNIEQRTVALFDEVLDHVHEIYLACLFFVVTQHLVYQLELLVVQSAISHLVELLLDADPPNPCHLYDKHICVTTLAGGKQKTIGHGD